MVSENISIPKDLLPSDGRFGSGPSKVRVEALEALAATGKDFLGTSHRKDTVKNVVARLQDGLREMYGLGDEWEVILGNGGATGLWDALSFNVIEKRSLHLNFGEFSSKFTKAVAAAQHLEDPVVIESEPGSVPELVADSSVDAYCYAHNETSTGAMAPLVRPAGAEGLMLVDATSAAGGMRIDLDAVDLYYFSPQKCFAGEGGLYIALANSAAVERIEKLSAQRWVPASLNLNTALSNSRKNQTYNTPALSTIYLTMHMVEWMNENGGLEFGAKRSEMSSGTYYDWADSHELLTPFVTDKALRSTTVATIDIDDSISADTVAQVLRDNGILDVDGYRKLGRNQLRLSAFPAIEPDDAVKLTKCIDHVLEQLA